MAPTIYFAVVFGILLSAGDLVSSAISKLQPSPAPMSTPYRNDQPLIYMNAFYDPKYHDSGSRRAELQGGEITDEVSNLIVPPAIPTTRTYTREEKAAILQKYKMLQNAKFKRGIANSVDFGGVGDSLAVESRDNLAMESGSPVVVKVQKSSIPSTNKKGIKDQLQTESKKEVKTETPKPAFNPHQPDNYYDYNNQNGFLRQAKDELIHGRRKLRAYYARPHKTRSFGKAFLEMGGQIGYW